MRKNALSVIKLFHQTVKNVPAYRAFINEKKINPGKIKTLQDFSNLPETNKKEYVWKYPLIDLFANRQLPSISYASSGSSGKPTFWFRTEKQEKDGGLFHEYILNKIFGIKKNEPTLVVICFSMGVWIAGGFTLASFREVTAKGYQITTITPGLEKNDILEILTTLAPNFKNIILIGYPPFLMDVLRAARSKSIRLNNKIFALTSGDKFSEEWRDDFRKIGNIHSPNHIVSIYGSADGGPLAYETPLTIYIRRKARDNSKIRTAVFGDAQTLPALFQYNTDNIFFEVKKTEFLITAPTACPLMRYNIHDEGNILNFKDLKKILAAENLLNEAAEQGLLKWNSPLVIKKGRTDVAVTFYALNIYPENIKAGLEDKKISALVSGQFFAFTQDTALSKNQKLCINVELAVGVKPSAVSKEQIKESIVSNLLALNIEYRKLSNSIGELALPKIDLFSNGEKGLRHQGVRGVLGANDKKTRIVE